MATERIGVIGGGILGLAVARRLGQVLPDAEITVLEKEDRVATHQTGHNSGVVHAGLYYKPGSLKARLCRQGVSMLREFTQEHGIAYDECGKLVVAVDDSELEALAEIEKRSIENGVPGLRRLERAEITDIEPHAIGAAALHSPHTAITDYTAVSEAMASDIRKAGGTVRLGFAVDRIRERNGDVEVGSGVVGQGGEELSFDRLVLCAGLQSDIVARWAGDVPGPAIVPFRGEYFTLKPDKAFLSRGLIYPVPDPDYPFLGVHFTKRVDGSVDIGPNAVLALAREGYRRRDIAPADLLATLRWPGFRKLAAQHWKMGAQEMAGSLSKHLYLARARQYVPELLDSDVVRAQAGVRAQSVDADGSLVDDFRIHQLGKVTAVRNAPSPGATSSLAIAEYVCGEMLGESAAGA